MSSTVPSVRPIGPRMAEALNYIARHPGCPVLAAVEYAAPGWRRQRQYAIVERLEARGMVARKRLPSGRYECRVTEAGAALL